MNKIPNSNNDEAELLPIFKFIGRGIENLFNFIGKLFSGLYNIILELLAHIYKRFFWYLLTLIVGIVVGNYLETITPKDYAGRMTVETNFNSSREVYSKIEELNQLAQIDKDSVELANRFNISKKQAASLKSFRIEPIIDERKRLELYDDFIKNTDTTVTHQIKYATFKKNLNQYNFKTHQITVISSDKNIFKKLHVALKEQLLSNPYLKDILQVNTENLEREKEALSNQLFKTDSLINNLIKIKINLSTRSGGASGSNIFISDKANNSGASESEEYKLLNSKLALEESRRDVYEKLTIEKNAINVISRLPVMGYNYKSKIELYRYNIPIICVLLTGLVFALLAIKKHLKARGKI